MPEYILTNEELEKMIDTNDEWITTRTGIKERRILKGEKQGTSVMAVKVLQQLMEKSGTDPKEIDAVIIGTPDHWHTLIAIDAMDAGKHIYVEKPMANTIYENMLVEKAANKYNKVVQVGQWQRSDKHWQDAMDFVHSGVLGQVRLVKAWASLMKITKRPVPRSFPPPKRFMTERI